MEHAVEMKEAFRAIGRKRRIDRPIQDASSDIAAFFAEATEDGLSAQISPLGVGEPAGILGIYVSIDRGDPQGFDAWIAVASQAKLRNGLDAIDVPSARYRVFKTTEPLATELTRLDDPTIRRLIDSDQLPTGMPIIEVYPFIGLDDVETAHEIWIPVEI